MEIVRKIMNKYYVTGEVREIIYANSPEEAREEFINLKGSNEELVMVYNDNGEELL